MSIYFLCGMLMLSITSFSRGMEERHPIEPHEAILSSLLEKNLDLRDVYQILQNRSEHANELLKSIKRGKKFLISRALWYIRELSDPDEQGAGNSLIARALDRISDLNDIVEEGGSTLLHTVVKSNSSNGNLVRLVLARGLKPDIVDNQGMSAMDYAINTGNIGSVRALIDYDAKITSNHISRAKKILRRYTYLEGWVEPQAILNLLEETLRAQQAPTDIPDRREHLTLAEILNPGPIEPSVESFKVWGFNI